MREVYRREGRVTMYRTDFELHEIPADLREFFEEVEVACGSPWRRVLETGSATRQTFAGSNGQQEHPPGTSHTLVPIERTTVGWEPSCACDAGEPRPCVVLDPFAGAGTVSLVAERLGRDSIGIELNPEYVDMSRRRIERDAPMFNIVDVAPS